MDQTVLRYFQNNLFALAHSRTLYLESCILYLVPCALYLVPSHHQSASYTPNCAKYLSASIPCCVEGNFSFSSLYNEMASLVSFITLSARYAAMNNASAEL